MIYGKLCYKTGQKYENSSEAMTCMGRQTRAKISCIASEPLSTLSWGDNQLPLMLENKII